MGLFASIRPRLRLQPIAPDTPGRPELATGTASMSGRYEPRMGVRRVDSIQFWTGKRGLGARRTNELTEQEALAFLQSPEIQERPFAWVFEKGEKIKAFVLIRKDDPTIRLVDVVGQIVLEVTPEIETPA